MEFNEEVVRENLREEAEFFALTPEWDEVHSRVRLLS